MSIRPVIFGIFLLFAASAVHSVPENEVLVLLDSLAVRETHSIFFKSLNGELEIFHTGDVSSSHFFPFSLLQNAATS